MDKAHILKIIEKGEGISVEFKKCSNKLNKDVFETVCAFLNRHGGHLYLGGILLFDKDETIGNVLPYHKTDAILRKYNLDRYDDRDDIRTNLMESYDRLMNFIIKHLPDPFYIEGDSRISVRNKVFREAISNILIHREYFNAFPAKMIIEKNRVLFENANRAHSHGLMTLDTFTPFPKNPNFTNLFRQS